MSDKFSLKGCLSRPNFKILCLGDTMAQNIRCNIRQEFPEFKSVYIQYTRIRYQEPLKIIKQEITTIKPNDGLLLVMSVWTNEQVLPHAIYQHQNENMNYEASLIPLVYSISRQKVFDNSHYVDVDPISVLMPYPELIPNISGFLLPFTLQTWFAVFCCYFIVALCYYALTKFGETSNKFYRNKNASLATKKDGRLFRAFYVSLEVLLGQDIYDHGVGDSRLKMRLLVGAWLLAGFVISLSYRCNLKAMLIKPNVKAAFNTFEEMVNQKKIKFFVNGGSVIEGILATSPPKSLFGRIYKGLSPPPPTSYVPFLAKGNLAYIGSYKSVQGLIQLTYKNGCCVTTTMKESSDILRVMGLIFKKGSKYLHYFDEILSTYIESGIWDLFTRLSLPNVQKCVSKVDVSLAEKPLSLMDFYGIFAMLMFGWLLSLIVFITEVLLHRMNTRKFKNR